MIELMNTRYFPQGIATGESFCNRDKERASLRTSICSHEHIILVAPRRYGKSSLIAKVLDENSCAGYSMDFFFAMSQADVRTHIAEGVSQTMSKLLPKSKSACEKLIQAVF